MGSRVHLSVHMLLPLKLLMIFGFDDQHYSSIKNLILVYKVKVKGKLSLRLIN
jgi:hypothetical protein